MPLDKNGHEVPDPTPMTIPSGFKRPETLAEQVRRLVRTTISKEAAENGQETFEESEDFDVGDDSEPSTPYETYFDPAIGKEITPQEFKQHEAIYRDRYLRAQAEYFANQDRLEVIRRAPSRAAPPPPAKPSGREATVEPADDEE